MSKRQLGIKDLHEVETVLISHSFPASKYERLGLLLGLLEPTLGNIEAKNRGNVAGCLRACLSAWLHQNDHAKSSTYEVLIAALRKMRENAVADGIEREKCANLPIYDGSGLDVTNGKHAVNILNRQIQHFHQLRDPFRVATFLEAAGMNIPEKTMKDLTNVNNPLVEKPGYLLRDVRSAIEEDYTMLRVFASVCNHVAGNEDICQAIIADYEATFIMKMECEDLEESFVKLMSEFQKEIDDRNPSDELLMKFKVFIDSRYSIQICTASEGVSVIARRCTYYDVTALEEVMIDLNYIEGQQRVACYRETVRRMVSCSAGAKTLLLDMEKLILEFEIGHDVDGVYQVEKSQLLCGIFGHMYSGVVKMHHSKENTLVCSFPLAYATLLMKQILQKSDLCRQKKIKSITVGHVPVWGREMYDKAYERLESKIEELSDKVAVLEEKMKDKDQTIEFLKGEVDKLRQEKSSLEEKLIVIQETHVLEKESFMTRESDLCQKLKEKEEEIKLLNQQLEEKEQQLQDKNEVMQEMRQELQSSLHANTRLEEALVNNDEERQLLTEQLALFKTEKNTSRESSQSELQLLLMEKKLQYLKQHLVKEREVSVESELREKLLARQKQTQAMILENEQLRSSLQTKAGLEEALVESKRETELLQEKLSSLSVQQIERDDKIQSLQSKLVEIRAQLDDKEEGLNTPGAVPCLDDTWAAVAKQKCSEIQNELLKEYQEQMDQKIAEVSHGQLPLEVEAQDGNHSATPTIMGIHHFVYEELKKTLLKRVGPFISATDNFAEEQEEKFKDAIVQGALKEFCKANEERSRIYCKETLQEQYQPIKAQIQSGDRFYTYQKYLEDLDRARNNYLSLARGPAKEEMLREAEKHIEQEKHLMKQRQDEYDNSKRLAEEARQREERMQQMMQQLQYKYNAREELENSQDTCFIL